MTDKTTPITIATVFKQRIVDMPDTIETKKDIETYSKNLIKEILNDFKKKNKKDGVELPKKPLNPYQQFVKDMPIISLGFKVCFIIIYIIVITMINII